MRAPRPARGFTLIELLVAITVMALLAIVSWRGLDAMARATGQNQQRADAVLTLQTGLSQWHADLDAIAPLAQTRPIAWDGRVLRITRHGSDPLAPAVHVVAWTLRPDAGGLRWRRWQSPPFSTRGEWEQAWSAAASWAQGAAVAQLERGADVALMPVERWQLAWFVDNQWIPAGDLPASDPTGPAAATAEGRVPNGVRLVLTLPPGDALAGVLTRDWVRPTVGAPRS